MKCLYCYGLIPEGATVCPTCGVEVSDETIFEKIV